MRLPHSLLSLIFATTVLCQTDSSPSSLIAEANALAAENSWGLALLKYQSALERSTDESESRSIENQVLIATVFGDEVPPRWRERSLRGEELNARLLKALEPYANSALEDDMALHLTEARLEVASKFGVGDSTELLRDSVLRLARAPETPGNWQRLAQFVRQQATLIQNSNWRLKEIIPVLTRLTLHAPNADLRALSAYLIMKVSPEMNRILPDHPLMWQETRQTAANTQVEALVEAAYFLWATDRGWHATAPLGDSLVIRDLIARAEQLKSNLNNALPEFRSVYISRDLDDKLRRWSSPSLRIEASRLQLPDQPIEFAYSTVGFPAINLRLYRMPFLGSMAPTN